MPVPANQMESGMGVKEGKEDAVKRWLTSVAEEGCQPGDEDIQLSSSALPQISLTRPSVDDHFVLGAEAKMMCGETPPSVTSPNRSTRRSSIAAMTPKHLKLLQAFANNTSESFNSDVSISTTTSVEQLLRERAGDPELILANLGFAEPQSASGLEHVRLPVRFLVSPSCARGISVAAFLDAQPDVRSFWEEAGEPLYGSHDYDTDLTFTSVSEMLAHMQSLTRVGSGGGGVSPSAPTPAPPGAAQTSRWRSLLRGLKRRGLVTPPVPVATEPVSMEPVATEPVATEPIDASKRRRRIGMSHSMPSGAPEWTEPQRAAGCKLSRQPSITDTRSLPHRFLSRDQPSTVIAEVDEDEDEHDEAVDVNRNLLVVPKTSDNDDGGSIVSENSIPSRFLVRRPVTRCCTEQGGAGDGAEEGEGGGKEGRGARRLRRSSSESETTGQWRRGGVAWGSREEEEESMEAEPMTRPMTGAMTQTMTESGTRPMTELMTQTMTESRTQPMTELMTESGTRPMTELMTQTTTELMTQSRKESEPTEPPPADVADDDSVTRTATDTPDGETCDDDEVAVPPPAHLMHRWRHSVHFRRTVETFPNDDDDVDVDVGSSLPCKQLEKLQVGEQASFELEEIQSTDLVQEEYHPSRSSYLVERGVLMRTGSAQSDSSGFAESADSSTANAEVIKTHWSSGDSESTLADVCGSARRLSDDSQVTCVTLAATPDAPSAGEGPDAKQDAAWWQARELQASWPRRRSASEPVARSASPAAARPDEGGRRGDDATAADARTTPAAAAPPGGGEGRQRVSCRHHRVLCCLLRQIPAVDQAVSGLVGAAPYLQWPVSREMNKSSLCSEVRLVQYALHRYEGATLVLEARARSTYDDSDIDDLELLSDDFADLRRLKSAIFRELEELSQQLAHRLKTLAAGVKRDSESGEGLPIVDQMVDVVKELLHQSYVVALMTTPPACRQPPLAADGGGAPRRPSDPANPSLIVSSLSELKSCVLAEMRADIDRRTDPLNKQIQVTEEKLEALRRYLDELSCRATANCGDGGGGGDGDFRDGNK